jgi:hypothetical protein
MTAQAGARGRAYAPLQHPPPSKLTSALVRGYILFFENRHTADSGARDSSALFPRLAVGRRRPGGGRSRPCLPSTARSWHFPRAGWMTSSVRSGRSDYRSSSPGKRPWRCPAACAGRRRCGVAALRVGAAADGVCARLGAKDVGFDRLPTTARDEQGGRGGKVWEPSHLPPLLRHAYAWRPYPRHHCWFRFSLSSGSTVLQ